MSQAELAGTTVSANSAPRTTPGRRSVGATVIVASADIAIANLPIAGVSVATGTISTHAPAPANQGTQLLPED
jgi:hypothetical protein